MDLKSFDAIYQQIPQKELPLLTESLNYLRTHKPYKGLRVIHNVHLTLSTLCKLHPLLVSGAEVTISTINVCSHSKAEKILKESNIQLATADSIVDEQFDVALDCCAALMDYIRPTYGAIELTQTGDIKYKQSNLPYPVISVDQSRLKNVETLLGTGDGFVRAFLKLTNEDINNKSFVLFGYGKVGKGVVRALMPYTSNITIIEKDEHAIEIAELQGLKMLHITNREQILACLKGAFCVVTATGLTGIISKYFDRTDFVAKYFANIGSEDEFGNKFSTQEVLFGKSPINFSLVEPTRARFLDPIFYAHNCGIDILLRGDITSGFHAFPKILDFKILDKWLAYFNYDLSTHEIEAAY